MTLDEAFQAHAVSHSPNPIWLITHGYQHGFAFFHERDIVGAVTIGKGIADGDVQLTKRDIITLIGLLESYSRDEDITAYGSDRLVEMTMSMYQQHVGDSPRDFMTLFKLYAPTLYASEPDWTNRLMKTFDCGRNKWYYATVGIMSWMGVMMLVAVGATPFVATIPLTLVLLTFTHWALYNWFQLVARGNSVWHLMARSTNGAVITIGVVNVVAHVLLPIVLWLFGVAHIVDLSSWTFVVNTVTAYVVLLTFYERKSASIMDNFTLFTTRESAKELR